MTDTVVVASSPVDSPTNDKLSRPHSLVVGIRRWIWKMVIATLALMAVGSATRVMNAGLACPDWPLCYGQLIPQQVTNFRVFLEWFHRFDAALIGLSTIALLGGTLLWRRQLPRWLPWLAAVALLLIVSQGILGGLTVTQLLRFDIVTAHLGMALLFFATLIATATCLLPAPGVAVSKPWLATSAIATVFVYGQCLLGALVGSRWALHQCLNLTQLCSVMNAHLWGILPPSLVVITLGWLTCRSPELNRSLRILAYGAVGCLLVQLLLGLATFHLHLQIEPLTVAHHTVGAALFGLLVVQTVLGWRSRLSHSTASYSKESIHA